MPQTPSPDDSSNLMPDAKKAILDQLRKLQHHARANIPAEIAQKTKSAFNVTPHPDDDEPLASPVSVLVYPQNPFVRDPEIRELAPTEARPALRNTRVWMRDSVYAVAQPDEDNNYLYWKDTPEFNQVNAFYFTTLTLRMYEKYAHRQIPWAFTSPRINIDPHAGQGMNAYYDEDNRTLGFYSFVHADGDIVNTAQSADVVAHEAGHAVLDGLRDLYNQSFGMGPLAFHESFADMSAVLVALNDDELVRQLLDWTDGDLRIDNFVTAVAERIIEQLMKAVENIKHIDKRTVYLRNALNHFTFVPFDDLSYLPPNPRDELGRESHNYSRLFTGAFYDALVNVYEHLRDQAQMNPRIAIHRARDVMGHILVYAVECGPVGELCFEDMARAFLTADHLLNDGVFQQDLIDAFDGRGILSQAAAQTHLATLDDLPPLSLPLQVDSALEAGIFLVDEVIPALGLPDDIEFTPMSAHRNKRGFAFLTYFTVRTITLEGQSYGAFSGVEVDTFGGLTLAFNPDGQLCSTLYRPVTDEDVRRIQVLTSDLIDHGLVTETTFIGGARVLSDEILATDQSPFVKPRFSYMVDQFGEDGDQAAKLVRDPMILDAVPQAGEGFIEYLRRWLGMKG
jgi:hypothetical protein